MNILLHKIELLVDRLIPPLLVVLLAVILGEVFLSQKFHQYTTYVDIFDGFIILVFAVDLGFKYLRVRKLQTFVKKYWLEIIATIPFFLIFRLLEFFRLSEFFERGQAIVHEGMAAGMNMKAEEIVKEAERVREASRTAKMIRTLRLLSRFPRFIRAIPFFEKPTGRHHWHEKITKRGHKKKR